MTITSEAVMCGSRAMNYGWEAISVLRSLAEDRHRAWGSLPKAPNGLSAHLKRIAPLLRANGCEVPSDATAVSERSSSREDRHHRQHRHRRHPHPEVKCLIS
jgi:hypothetical protein